MRFVQIKEEVERIIAGPIPVMDWEILTERVVTLPPEAVRSMAIHLAEEYKKLKSKPCNCPEPGSREHFEPLLGNCICRCHRPQ